MRGTGRRWIGVDFFGTLCRWDGSAPNHFGAPIIPMVRRVRGWLQKGTEVRVFTSLMCEEDEQKRAVVREFVEKWCESHVGKRLEVTNVKDHDMIQLWDDKAIRVIKNTGLSQEEFAKIGGRRGRLAISRQFG